MFIILAQSPYHINYCIVTVVAIVTEKVCRVIFFIILADWINNILQNPYHIIVVSFCV